MPRVSEIESDGGDAVLQPIFAKDRELFGGPLNPTKIYAHRPPVLKAMRDMAEAIERDGLIPSQLRSLVYLRVALLNGCPF
jgi:alkylhydroperoxidase family enzyme